MSSIANAPAPAGAAGAAAPGITANAAPQSSLRFDTVDTPIGTLLVVATGSGVVRVVFGSDAGEDVLTELSTKLRLPVAAAPGGLDDVAAELREYFAGTREAFTVKLDRSLSGGFYRQAQDAVAQIPYGKTASYTEVAAQAGSPRAVRAVGSACATNPLPILVPCHRVLRSDGKLGGYLGDPGGPTAGLAIKQHLLDLEAQH